MAQQLIAINGNEEFPYNLQPTDIAEAMGFPAGIAPGGFNASGTVTLPSGSTSLNNYAWNNTIQVNLNVTSVDLPTSNPNGAIIHFFPQGLNGSNPTETWTLNAVGANQFIYSPNTGFIETNITSIQVPYNCSLTILSRGDGEIDVIGGSYLITNNTNNGFTGAITINPSNLCRNNFSSQNLIYNGNWEYGILAGWNYSSSLDGLTHIGNNASNLYLNISGPSSAESYTITSYNSVLPNYNEGVNYLLSGMIFNLTTDSSGVTYTDSTYDITVDINFYNSSGTLLETQTVITAPAGQGWTFYSNNIQINSTTSAASYVTITLNGSTYPANNNTGFSQFKLEFNNGNINTFFSDEASINVFSQNNLSGSGYQKLPSGMIMQWGTATNTGQSGSTTATATFPIAFPNGCFQIVMTDSGSDAYRFWTDAYNNTSFQIGAMVTDASGTATYATAGDASGRFIAFGW